jgi:UDP-glucuronate decarboxylase
LKRILVTGGAGFLGSHLCSRLIHEGHRVTCLDNLSTGRLVNLAPICGHSRFEFVKWDVADAFDFEVDEIYNLACPASPPHYQKSPTTTIRTSVLGAINALELANRNGATLLQASTSEVYGNPEVHPQSEPYYGHVNPIGIRSCYDEGKRCAESLCFSYRREFGTSVKVARIFNTYGPSMDPQDGRVISNLIMQALRHQPLTIYGDGTQTRSFCYIDDLIDGLVRLMASPEGFTGPVNLGNDGEFTILELAGIVKRLTGTDAPLVFTPLPADDPLQRRPVLDLAKQTLSWSPRVPLEEGLVRTIAYFKTLA